MSYREIDNSIFFFQIRGFYKFHSNLAENKPTDYISSD